MVIPIFRASNDEYPKVFFEGNIREFVLVRGLEQYNGLISFLNS
jgi:hypothetical protein